MLFTLKKFFTNYPTPLVDSISGMACCPSRMRVFCFSLNSERRRISSLWIDTWKSPSRSPGFSKVRQKRQLGRDIGEPTNGHRWNLDLSGREDSARETRPESVKTRYSPRKFLRAVIARDKFSVANRPVCFFDIFRNSYGQILFTQIYTNSHNILVILGLTSMSD